MFAEGVVITTEGLRLQQKVSAHNRFGSTTEGMWLQQKVCDYNRRFVNTTGRMWLQQKVRDYKGKFVIPTEGWWSQQVSVYNRCFVITTEVYEYNTGVVIAI